MILSYVNHLNVSCAFEELSELSTIDLKERLPTKSLRSAEKDCSCCGGGGASSEIMFPSSSTLKSSVTAMLRTKRDAAEEAKMEREMDWELSSKEREEVGGMWRQVWRWRRWRERGMKLKQPWRRKRRDRVDSVKRGLRRILLGWPASLFIHT